MPFAAYPAPFVHDAPGGKGKKIQQLVFGDFVRTTGRTDGDWVEVCKARNASGWMRAADLQDERVLEVNFVDVGQGDACFVVTPDDRRILIDAGKADNLLWFLRWRFNLRNHPERVVDIDHAVITHSDADHYQGFQALFESPNFRFGTVHHNGIVERAGAKLLGPEEKVGKVTYLTDLVPNKTKLRTLLNDPDAVGRKIYPRMLKTALGSGRVGDIRMLSVRDGHLPGYEADQPLRIEVLAPVPERVGGSLRLRRLGSDGLTKNGHSIVLRLHYGDVKLLLGGDLNRPAQDYLLRHYTGLGPDAAVDDVVPLAAPHFGADVAKSCHHGSGDFSTAFLRSVDALVTVISSGDDEPYAHPRPDALGALGRHGRGDRPLVFSTELARSAREFLRRPEALRAAIEPELTASRDAANAGTTPPDEAEGRPVAAFERAIAVYGMINVRTDGKRVVLAQKLERPAGRGVEWDYHRLEAGPDGLAYVAEH